MLAKRSCFSCLALLCISVLFTGCGSADNKPIANLIPCQGTISFNGSPLDHGIVYFTPEDPTTGRAASGTVSAGQFKMTTTASSPGVVAGKYKVAVESRENVKYDPLKPTVAPSLIPEKFSNIKTSNLSVEVAKGMAPVKLELKKD